MLFKKVEINSEPEKIEIKRNFQKKYNYVSNNFRDDTFLSEDSSLRRCKKEVLDFFKLRSFAYKEVNIFKLIDEVKNAYQNRNPETAEENFSLYLHGLFYYATHIDWEYDNIINLIKHPDFFYNGKKEITFGYDQKTHYSIFHTSVFGDHPTYFKQIFSQMEKKYGESESTQIFEHYLFKEDRRKFTPFHLACFEGSLRIVQYLLTDSPKPVNTRCQDILLSPSNIHPFIMACQRGQLKVVKYLLSTIHKQLPLDSKEFQKIFLEKHPTCRTSGLLEVISDNTYWNDFDTNQQDFIDIVTCLFETAFDFYGKNTKEFESKFLTQENEKGNILVIACQLRKIEIVKVILNNLAKFYNQSPKSLLDFINKQYDKGNSPIQIAARNGDQNIVNLIANYGVDERQADENGRKVRDYLNQAKDQAKHKTRHSKMGQRRFAFHQRHHHDFDKPPELPHDFDSLDFDSLFAKKRTPINSSKKRKRIEDEQNESSSLKF